MASSAFVLSLDGKPSCNRSDKWIQDLLSKGGSAPLEATLRPSPPLAEELVREIRALEETACQTLSNGVEEQYFLRQIPQSGKKSKSKLELQLVSPADNKDFSSHLLYGCACGDLEAVQLVLASSTDLDVNAPLSCPPPADRQLSVLCVAALSGNPLVCEALLKAGSSVNWTDSQHRSAVHWAVLSGQPNTAKYLLDHGADLAKPDANGLNLLHYACSSGQLQITTLLIKQSPSLISQHSPKGVSPLLLACINGHADVIKVLLKFTVASTIASTGDDHRMNALHYAAWSGDVKSIKVLARHQPYFREALSQSDVWGRTPLLVAAAKGDSRMCQFLLKKGARLTEVDCEKRGLLHWAVLSDQAQCVEWVLNGKGGLESCAQLDSGGAAPLHYAAIAKNGAILSAILSKDAGLVGVPTELGHTPLVWTAVCRWLEGVQTLLATQGQPPPPPPAKSDDVYLQPLCASAAVGSVQLSQALLAAGYEVGEPCPNDGYTPLHYASTFGHVECVREFLREGADVDSLSSKQESPLHLAVIHGHSSTVSELLKGGADVDRPLGTSMDCAGGASSGDQPRASDGHIPLYLAASRGHLRCCKVLVESGVNTGTRSKTVEGLTALDIAMKNDHIGCANYLISCHAPSGGGVYHRAACTIQAVWKYHKYKSRQAAALHWSTVILQRCVRRWLCGLRSHRLRRAREAARNRAASIIQRRWQQYVIEKRRYEATYSKLKARLQQEQLMTALIVAELQAQVESVRLPPAPLHSHGARKKTFRVVPTTTLPRKPLQVIPPVIKVTKKLRSSGEELKPHSEELGDHYRKRIHLPPVPKNQHTFHCVAPDFQSELSSESKPQSIEKSTTNTAKGAKPITRLPPIPNTTSLVSVVPHSKDDIDGSVREPLNPNLPLSNSTPYGEQPTGLKTTPEPPAPSNRICSASLKLPSRSLLKLTRRSSTFKATPLGYRPFLPHNDNRKSSHQGEEPLHSSTLENMAELKLDSLEDLPTAVGVTFAEEVVPCDHSVTETGSEGSEEKEVGKISRTGSNSSSGSDGGGCGSLVDIDEDKKNLFVNQLERYERLMRVLDLLKQAKETGKREEEGGGMAVGNLKDHIQLALDEAIMLRMETQTKHSNIGLSPS